MQTLLEGYRRFRAKTWPAEQKLFESLAEHGQAPRSLVITCVDSRVDPAVIFDAGPGEMLTVRNVANLVPPFSPDEAFHGTSAALEFGVRVLGVEHVVVLGHSQCGGVRALLEDAPVADLEFVTPWMSIARSARERALKEDPPRRQQRCEFELIKVSLENLRTFPWIESRIAARELKLHGAWFEIRSGTLLILRPDGGFAEPAQAQS